MEEETGIKVAAPDLQRVGHLTFLFPYQPAWSQVVHVFLAKSWDGEAVERAEARPLWCPTSEIPYARMWQDSAYWLPRILAGQKVRARFTFREDNESVDEVEIEEIGDWRLEIADCRLLGRNVILSDQRERRISTLDRKCP